MDKWYLALNTLGEIYMICEDENGNFHTYVGEHGRYKGFVINLPKESINKIKTEGRIFELGTMKRTLTDTEDFIENSPWTLKDLVHCLLSVLAVVFISYIGYKLR